MKRTLYEMIGVPPGAEPGELDVAFVRRLAELKPRVDLGDPDAMNEQRMLHDGYEVLADPARRTHYDNSLAQAFGAPSRRVDFLPDDSGFKRKSRNQSIVLVALLAALGGVVYKQMSTRVESARQEHHQAVVRARGDMQAPQLEQAAAPAPQADPAAEAANPPAIPVVAEAREPARPPEKPAAEPADQGK